LNEDLGSVITWDFDILRHEVLFSIFHTKTPIPFTSTPPTPTSSAAASASSGAAHPSSLQSAQAQHHHHHTPVNPNEHKSVIDKSWKEGVDYTKIDSSVVCHDGESIQVKYKVLYQ